MKNIKNSIITSLCFLSFSSCDSTYRYLDKYVDNYFNDKRVERMCARGVIDLFDLQRRINSKNAFDNFFFSKKNLQLLERNKDRLLSIYKEGQKGNLIKKIEEDVSKLLLGEESIYSECLSLVRKQSKCKNIQPSGVIDCYSKAVSLFIKSSIIKSPAIKRFPEENQNELKKNLDQLKTYLKD